MTFFLPAYDPAKVAPRRGPDIRPPSNFTGIGAAVSKGWQDADVAFQRGRQRIGETDDLATQAAQRLGVDRLRKLVEEQNAKAIAAGTPSHVIDATTPEDMLSGLGPNGSKRVLEMAREDAKANPSKWQDIDLSEEGIDTRLTERRAKELEDNEQIIALSPNPGLNDFVGSAVAAIADPINIGLAAFGGGSGSFLRIIGREAALNAGAEGLSLPGRYRVAEELDKPEPGVLETLALGAVAGGVLGGLAYGVGRGIEYYRTRSRTSAPPGADPVYNSAAIGAAEDAILAGENPVIAADAILRKAPPSAEFVEDVMADIQRVSTEVRRPLPDDLNLPRSSTAIPGDLDLPRLDVEAATKSAARYAAAKEVDPVAFDLLEQSQTKVDSYRRWLAEMGDAQDGEVRSLLDGIDAKEADLKSQLTSMKTGGRRQVRDQLRLVAAAREEAATLSGRRETPDMSQVRRSLIEEGLKIRDLGPRLARAYRAAKPAPEMDLPRAARDQGEAYRSPDPTEARVPASGERAPDTAIPPIAQSFDPGAKVRSELFDSPTAPKAQEFDNARVEELRQSLEIEGDRDLGLVSEDGRALTSLSDALAEIDEMDALVREMDLCRIGKATTDDAG
ncbi:MAG: hypothetical protein DI533_00440 [Cereibacter sphaeroides]|uniref:Uncharacterized protein n=1 Tax=Cereibacter sphaeroides TaxID=1063 RepID=A0A2W5S830_CERSP|nr:MAG: hypothetical protein DI533_00440 [Cereibacter sphaeroides]